MKENSGIRKINAEIVVRKNCEQKRNEDNDRVKNAQIIQRAFVVCKMGRGKNVQKIFSRGDDLSKNFKRNEKKNAAHTFNDDFYCTENWSE